ncbi:sugar ABC transporter permease [Caldilinea sp.]|uniref:carbohydrate ABC transporter permease n=1 Tax=Caldilinea sp. TaxID=2293560 RepID=UPI003134F741|nr:sugar ABC transporter permease [Anaerolineales bacterium]
MGYLFIAPWLVAFFAFTLIPIIASFVLAFTNYDVLNPNWSWVGLQNFERMFTRDPRYIKSLQATFFYAFTAIPLRLAFALAVAMLLNTHRRGVSTYRAAYYAPSIVGGSVAVAVMWREIFGADGLINAILGTDITWLGNPNTAIWTLIVLAVWQFGSPMLIFLAGLKQIPREFYEAASIDGANGWQQFWGITLPLLTPIIFFNLVMQLISGFMVFTQAFIITGGAPLDTTLFYALYLYQRAFVSLQMGYASAMAWVLLAIVGIMTALVFRSSSYWVFYGSQEEN